MIDSEATFGATNFFYIENNSSVTSYLKWNIGFVVGFRFWRMPGVVKGSVISALLFSSLERSVLTALFSALALITSLATSV